MKLPFKCFLNFTTSTTARMFKAILFCALSPALFLNLASAQKQNQQPALQEYDGQIKRTFTEPIEQSIVSSTEVGVLKRITVKEGDYVSAGQLLGELDNQILRQSLRMAKARSQSTAQLDALRSRMKMLEKRTKKVDELVAGGHANPYEREQIVAEFETATSEFRAAEDELHLNLIEVDRIQAQLLQRSIKSPFDGFVVTIHKSLGELISGTEPNFATVVRLNELKAKFYLKAQSLDQLKVGDSVSVRVGRKQISKKATVIYVAPIIDPDSGTGRIDVKIKNEDLKIRSGTSCVWDHVIDNTRRPNQKPASRTANIIQLEDLKPIKLEGQHER